MVTIDTPSRNVFLCASAPLRGIVFHIGKRKQWHGFQYDVKDGHLLADPKSRLDTFRVSVENGEVRLQMPQG